MYHTLSHLIPPLAEMLEAHKITLELAYKFAQLPPDDQQQIVDSYDAAARENKALRDNLEDLSKEIIRLAEERDAEIREITTQHEEELKRLTKELDEEAVQARIAQKEAEVAEVRAKAAEAIEQTAENVARVQQGAAEQIEMLAVIACSMLSTTKARPRSRRPRRSARSTTSTACASPPPASRPAA